MPRAILLKTKSTPEDPYDYAFRHQTPFVPVFVPVLVHQRVNEERLRQILLDEPRRKYDALIITSQRAVEALGDAMNILNGRTVDSFSNTDDQLAQLRAMRVYTVGPATALAITKLQFNAILGADTGNGDALANLIVQQYRRDQCMDFNDISKNIEEDSIPPRLPLLFLVGDKRRDIIPKRLGEREIPLEELTIYETTLASTFEEELDRVIADNAEGEIEWIVFFSPSGAEIALEKLKKMPQRIKLATIGPTTEAYLKTQWNITPDMVSSKPEPISMVQGILKHK